MKPGAATDAAPLAELASWATVRETVPYLTYEQAVSVAESILQDIRVGKLTKPYPENVRHSLRVAAAVFAREAEATR